MDRKKLLTIFGIAWVSAALLTWLLYAKTTAPRNEASVRILAAARDLPAGTRIQQRDLKFVTIPAKDKPGGALLTPPEALNRALLFPVNQNEAVTAPKLSSLSGAEGVAATILPGMRAVSISFTDASGVSGLMQPRSRVDVLFTRTGTITEAMTVTVLEDVTVLSVGRNVEVQPSATNVKGAVRPPTGNQTATLMVTPEQAQKLELAKNQGKISLALRNPSDRGVRGEESKASTIEEIDPLLLARGARRGSLRGLRSNVNLKDKAAWERLIAEEPDETKKKAEVKIPEPPPKPRLVVDVFRGEKHVQEIFP